MNQSSESYLSPDLIISEVAETTGDPEYKFTMPGTYMSMVQKALQELSFDTFFLQKDKVYEIKDCLKFTLPSGFFNILNVFVFNGDDCNPTNSRPVWFKRDYSNKISRNTYNNQNDPFFGYHGSNPPGNVFFCGIRNGVIELSPNCKTYQKLLVRANGLICDIGEVPMIPMFFREAVIDYCVSKILAIRIANPNAPENMINRWQYLLGLHKSNLEKPFDGSWDKAMHRVRKMDKKEKQDLLEYLSKLDALQY